MKLSYRLSLLCQLPSPTEELETPVYDTIPTLFITGMEDTLQVKCLTVGCRVKFFDEGDYADVIGAFWMVIENPIDESGIPVRRLRLSFKIQFDDGECELLPAAWLKVSSAVVRVPFDYERQLVAQRRKKEYLTIKYSIHDES